MLLLNPTRKSGMTSILREEKDITFQMDELQYLLSESQPSDGSRAAQPRRTSFNVGRGD